MTKALLHRDQAYVEATLSTDEAEVTIDVPGWGTFGPCKSYDGDFPQTDTLWPDATDGVNGDGIALNPVRLAVLAKVIRQDGAKPKAVTSDPGFAFRFAGATGPGHGHESGARRNVPGAGDADSDELTANGSPPEWWGAAVGQRDGQEREGGEWQE